MNALNKTRPKLLFFNIFFQLLNAQFELGW